MGQAEQDPDLPRSVGNVLGRVQSHLCLTEWWGKWKCRRGMSTLGAACPAQEIMFSNLCCTLDKFGGSDNITHVALILYDLLWGWNSS